MPARVIRGEINESVSLAAVSMAADLTFRCLLVAVDDFGRLDARPLKLKAVLFPMRGQATPEAIAAWVEQLADLPDPPLVKYEVEGRPYLALTKWEKHRGKARRAKFSRYPAPPLTASAEILGRDSASEDLQADPPEGSGTRDEGSGTRDEGRDRSPSSVSVKTPPRKRKHKGPKATAFPSEQNGRAKLEEELHAWAQGAGECPELDCRQAVEIVADWADPKGEKKLDWLAACRNAVRAGWAYKRLGESPASTAKKQLGSGTTKAEATAQAARELFAERRGS